ncbi:hypothetical protein KIW84_055311 [Lathyrus oleraceus]|uniref:Uncharacterized protein n=1 Tax=Pisum sativum TaxID=3888 RepID=A0A9D5AIG8_PEA|nr:hypothetical protein KIW84_055311 [Pisum sativum]
MDSMIISEASKFRMQMKEVPGTKCIAGNLEGVITVDTTSQPVSSLAASAQLLPSPMIMNANYVKESSCLHFSLNIAHKLDENSFHLWPQQIELYINTHGLTELVLCTRIPLKFVDDDERAIGSEYLHKIRTIVDALASICDLVPTSHHINVILEGFPTNFAPAVSVVESKFGLMDLDEKVSTPDLISVNLTHASSNPPNFEDVPFASVESSPSMSPAPHTNQDFHQFRGNKGSRGGRPGRGRGRFHGSSVQFQVCSKFGHTTLTCWLPTPSRNVSSFSTLPCAFIANSVPAASASWFPNSGASFHVTNDSKNIQQMTPFEGPIQIFIENGQGKVDKDALYEFPSLNLASNVHKLNSRSSSVYPTQSALTLIQLLCLLVLPIHGISY